MRLFSAIRYLFVSNLSLCFCFMAILHKIAVREAERVFVE